MLDHSLLLFTAPVSSIRSKHHNKNRVFKKKYASGHQ
jgi:hypothetical protein